MPCGWKPETAEPALPDPVSEPAAPVEEPPATAEPEPEPTLAAIAELRLLAKNMEFELAAESREESEMSEITATQKAILDGHQAAADAEVAKQNRFNELCARPVASYTPDDLAFLRSVAIQGLQNLSR